LIAVNSLNPRSAPMIRGVDRLRFLRGVDDVTPYANHKESRNKKEDTEYTNGELESQTATPASPEEPHAKQDGAGSQYEAQDFSKCKEHLHEDHTMGGIEAMSLIRAGRLERAPTSRSL
jgi:hypothetical protein